MIIEASIGDITSFPAQAVVNAAKQSLLGGGGVDGAIHNAAGPELLKACEQLPVVDNQQGMDIRCPTGEARVTDAYDMVANQIIVHTVGPDCRIEGVSQAQADLNLASCYANSIKTAYRQHGKSSIAFPAISTGIYSFPLERATIIAVQTCMAMRHEVEPNFRVSFVCFDISNFLVYDRVIEAARRRFKNQLVI